MTTAEASARARLLEATARVLAERGPEAVSTRKVALAAGVSTMGVYTHFGSIGELVTAVVENGFQRLAERFAAVPRTDDPVADLHALSVAYVEYACENPNLFRVMFGGASLGPFRRTTPQELQTGQAATLDEIVRVIERAVRLGRFGGGSAWVLTNQWWSSVHGYVMLELGGYIRPQRGRDKVLRPMLDSLFVGFAAATR